MTAEFVTEPLTTAHELGHLDSGRQDIDTWLATQAKRLQRDGTLATWVWCDGQSPYVYGFYSLTPYRLVPDRETRISGHAGGALSGYLLAKIGVNRRAARESYHQVDADGDEYDIPIPAMLIIDALIDMEHAAGTAGGRWAFVETTNEPDYILAELETIGFQPINSAGSTMHFLKLTGSHSSIRDDEG